MPSYNIQKRKTLDRLSRRHFIRLSRVINLDLSKKIDSIFDDLNDGKTSLKIDNVKTLSVSIDRILKVHEFDTVKTAISDGIQEVTPDNRLGLWMNHSNDCDPLVTLDRFYPSLAKTRDRSTKSAIKKSRKRNKFSIAGLRNLIIKDYLKILKRGYRDLASDWLGGESTIKDVKSMIEITFQKTQSQATAIFRTETTNHFNTARADYFQNETSMDFMQIFAVTDGRISDICEDRHEWVFPISEALQPDKKPAFHPNCRTIQRPLTSRLASHRRLIEKGLAMNPSTFTPLPKNWNAA